MQKFTEKIVSMMQAEKLFQTQGGPIILSQVRNLLTWSLFRFLQVCLNGRSVLLTRHFLC